MHPKIFFRNSEIEKIQQEYHNSTNTIQSEAKSYFQATNSLDHLYFKVGILENSKSITQTLVAKEREYNLHKGSFLDPYVDPFSVSPSSVSQIDYGGSEFIFYFTICILSTLVLTLFSKLKKLKVLLLLSFICLLIYNLVNYYIIEPQNIAEIKTFINLKEYKDRQYMNEACSTFDSLYVFENHQQKMGTYNESNYNYDVLGKDKNGNSVQGNVDVDSESGNGYIINSDNERININVEWEGKGELRGYDDKGNNYHLYTN